MNALKTALIVFFALTALTLAAGSAFAYSGFPSNDYPHNQYGYESTYYNGPWGERVVYGAYGYFPNFNSYPYGYRTYGYFYTPWDMRYGTTMNGYGSYGGYGSVW